ncbi:MAG: ABC transporter ATP-binding protein [Candidatus Peregrinibacteria bacterium]
MISAKNITVAFNGTPVLENISFEIQKGEYVGIIGPNGAGKSTLLKTILGMITPTSGTLAVDEGVRFGFVPQNYLPKISFSISVRETLEMGLKRRSFWRRAGEKEQLEEKLSLVGLDSSFLPKPFHALSGGQKQRVIIARALLQNPEILLFDEPLSGVDFATKIQLYDLLAEINTTQSTTILFVSHEIESVIERCHRVLCLNKRLHEGCHPLDFIQGKTTQCAIPPEKGVICPVHHHHPLYEKEC